MSRIWAVKRKQRIATYIEKNRKQPPLPALEKQGTPPLPAPEKQVKKRGTKMQK
jgi:hypothetical protein